MSEALYRKYRPQVFSDVVGQDNIVNTLQNAISQNKVSHAYLFTGPRGTGKTTMARLLSKAMLCSSGQTESPAPNPNPCGVCEDCRLVAAGSHPDVYELDAASRTGVENVREEIIGRVQFAPVRRSHKIYIIDEVHMLSTAAFNALLKTLEEPPEHVVFVLCTTDPQKVPETILSRCQRFDFKGIGNESMVSKLGAVCVSEGVQFEGSALDLVAFRANGGMRDALTFLEQLIAFCDGNITLSAAQDMLGGLDTNDVAAFVQAVGQRDVPQCFSVIDSLVESGADLLQFTNDLAQYMRGLYVLCADADVSLNVSPAVRDQMQGVLPAFTSDRLLHDLCILGDVVKELKTSTNSRLVFEIAAVRLARPETDLTLESLAERISRLEGAARMEGASVAAQSFQGANLQRENNEVPEVTQSANLQRENNAQPTTAQDANLHDFGSAAQQFPQDGNQQHENNEVHSMQATQSSQNAASAEDPWGSFAADPAHLQRTWKQIQGELKNISMPHAAFFLGVVASYSQTEKLLEIQFPAGNQFAFEKVREPQISEELAQAIERTLGVRAPFKIVREGDEGAPVVSSPVEAINQTEEIENERAHEKEPENKVNTKYEAKKEDIALDVQRTEQKTIAQGNQITEEKAVPQGGEKIEKPEKTEEPKEAEKPEDAKESEETNATTSTWRDNVVSVFGDIPIEKM